MNPKRKLIRSTWVVGAVVLIAVGAVAQSPGARSGVPQGTQSQDERIVRSYPLAHAVASDVANALERLLRAHDGRSTASFSCTVDERTNSLLLLVSPGAEPVIADIIEALDVSADDSRAAQGPQVRVYPIRAANVAEIAGILTQVFARSSDKQPRELSLAYDTASRQIVARAEPAILARLEDVLKSLDVLPSAAAPDEMACRLIWLVSGTSTARPIPDDLSAVVNELSTLGIDGLGLAAQSIIRVRSGHEFETSFGVELDESWQMRVRGEVLSTTRESRELQIQLEGRARSETPPVSVETVIQAPAGHFVVLGATPIGPRDSVFVLQMSDGK